MSSHHFQALGLISFLQLHPPWKLLLRDRSKVWSVSWLKWNKAIKQRKCFTVRRKKTLVHFFWGFCSKYLPCQSSLIKHKKWTECTFSSKCNKNKPPNRFQTKPNFFIHHWSTRGRRVSYSETIHCFVARISTRWMERRDGKRDTLPKTNIEILFGNAEI